MKATLLPLEGKYYETEIEVETDKGENIYITLCGGGGDASDRELEIAEITRKDYDRDEVVDTADYLDGEECPVTAREFVDDPGGHYERQETYEIAKMIVDMLNRNPG